jgi:hypothetical protein
MYFSVRKKKVKFILRFRATSAKSNEKRRNRSFASAGPGHCPGLHQEMAKRKDTEEDPRRLPGMATLTVGPRK